jgi:hypothetical protein
VFLAQAEALRASGCLEAIDQAITARPRAIMVRVNRTTILVKAIRQMADATKPKDHLQQFTTKPRIWFPE